MTSREITLGRCDGTVTSAVPISATLAPLKTSTQPSLRPDTKISFERRLLDRAKSGLCFLGFILATILGSAQTTANFIALPDTNAAANAVSNLATSVNQSVEATSLKSWVLLTGLDAGFLIGTTTAVHELGHARQVRSLGGRSQWETGDVNWWSYLSHRDPLASGETQWRLPRIATVDERLSIAVGGFNATTAWDESVAGHGLFGLVSARYSTLWYEFSGVGKSDDDLTQIERLYASKGYRITRHEMQGWQLLTGFVTQINSSVKAYTYFSTRGVSVKAVAHWRDWSVATEAVVHGAPGVEVELGQRLDLGENLELLPKILVSARGMGGALKAGLHLRNTTVSLNCQWVNPTTLLATRAKTSFDFVVAMRI